VAEQHFVQTVVVVVVTGGVEGGGADGPGVSVEW